jgi:hypothetical protein
VHVAPTHALRRRPRRGQGAGARGGIEEALRGVR